MGSEAGSMLAADDDAGGDGRAILGVRGRARKPPLAPFFFPRLVETRIDAPGQDQSGSLRRIDAGQPARRDALPARESCLLAAQLGDRAAPLRSGRGCCPLGAISRGRSRTELGPPGGVVAMCRGGGRCRRVRRADSDWARASCMRRICDRGAGGRVLDSCVLGAAARKRPRRRGGGRDGQPAHHCRIMVHRWRHALHAAADAPTAARLRARHRLPPLGRRLDRLLPPRRRAPGRAERLLAHHGRLFRGRLARRAPDGGPLRLRARRRRSRRDGGARGGARSARGRAGAPAGARRGDAGARTRLLRSTSAQSCARHSAA